MGRIDSAYLKHKPGQYLDQEYGLNYNYFWDHDPKMGSHIGFEPSSINFIQHSPFISCDQIATVRCLDAVYPQAGLDRVESITG